MKNSQEPPPDDHISCAAPEESSWTFYFEEFLWQNDEHMIMNCDETLNYLVSDAASSAVVKKAACVQDGQAEGGSCKKLRFKKRKIKGVTIDDALEDTASSPVNSAKITHFDQAKTKNKKILHIPEEKIDTCEEENKRREFNDSNMELKEKGLCLVPLSSRANYLS